MIRSLKKCNNNLMAFLAILFFLTSMLPIWYLAGYARPSGDDYGYSVLTHAAWLDTRSLIQVFKAAIETVKTYYHSWNGDWFTTFLFSLMPEVFVPYSFWIVPYIMTGVVILATLIFMLEICGRVMKFSCADCLIFTSLVLFASYQYIPSTAIGMYWYVGAIHYMLPHAAGLLGIAFISKFLRNGKISTLTGITLCALVIGGSSYFTSLLLFIVFIITGLLGWKKEKKRIYLLCIPFLVWAVGFIVQCKSPGNLVRGGGNFGFSLSLAVFTVFESLKRGAFSIIFYLREKTLIFIVLAIIALLGWEAVNRVGRKIKFTYPFPLLFIILMYGIYSAMFAPEIYSEVYDSIEISLGPATIQYFTFLITACFSILYCEGWFFYKLKCKSISVSLDSFMDNKYRSCILYPSLILCFLLVIFNRGWLRESVDFRVVEYVNSGQADDFKAQIASQMEILLNESIKDAYLVPINPEQGPLMHMPVTTDENAFTNRVVCNFYRKNRVVMVEQQSSP